MPRLRSEGRGRQIWPAVNLFLQSSTHRCSSDADINMQGTLSHTKRWWFIWTCESAGPCGPQLERVERPHPAAPASHVVATPPASLPFTKKLPLIYACRTPLPFSSGCIVLQPLRWVEVSETVSSDYCWVAPVGSQMPACGECIFMSAPECSPLVRADSFP